MKKKKQKNSLGTAAARPQEVAGGKGSSAVNENLTENGLDVKTENYGNSLVSPPTGLTNDQREKNKNSLGTAVAGSNIIGGRIGKGSSAVNENLTENGPDVKTENYGNSLVSPPTGLTNDQRRQMYDMRQQSYASRKAEREAVRSERKEGNAKLQDAYRDMKTMAKLSALEQKEKDEYRIEREKVVKRTRKDCAELSDWILSPEQGKSVPKPIREAVTAALADIDWGAEDGHINNKATRSWAERVQVLENMVLENEMHMNEDEDSDTALTFPPGLASAMNDLRKSLEESDAKFLSDMDNDQIKALRDTLQIIKGACQKINVLHGRLRGVSVADQGTRTVDYAAGAKAKKQSDNRWVRAFDDLFNSDMRDAYSWAHTLGKGGEEMMAQLSDGMERYYKRMQEASVFTSATMKDFGLSVKDLNNWAKLSSLYQLSKTHSRQMEVHYNV